VAPHPIHRIVSFELAGAHALWLRFEDRTERTIDFSTVLAGEIYGPLADAAFFRQVRLDPEVHTVVWPNGADFDPADLHDWPTVAPAFERLARTWSTAHA
jgi:Protein of unknown function (DUF2442)